MCAAQRAFDHKIQGLDFHLVAEDRIVMIPSVGPIDTKKQQQPQAQQLNDLSNPSPLAQRMDRKESADEV
jgi:hypothetical protein